MYNWFSFALNVAVMVSIFPVMILKVIDVKKSIFLGGLCITAAQVLSYLMITQDKDYKAFRENSATVIFIVSLLGGQGACLILFALLQSIMESTTVLCCHFVSGLLIRYFYAGRQIFGMLSKSDFFGSYKAITLFTIIAGVIVYLLTMKMLADSDEEDETGLLGRAASLSKGIVNRRTSKGFIYIQFALTCALLIIQFLNWEDCKYVAIFILILWILNLIVPLQVLISLDEESMRKAIGSPRDVEKFLMEGKGKDKDFSDVKSSKDYILICTAVAINVGMSITVCENVGLLARENEFADKLQ